MVGYNRAIGIKQVILAQTNTVNKITLIIINPLTCFGSLLNYPQKQYDVL